MVSTHFENILIETFEKLSIDKFKVNLEAHHIFVCGGEINGAVNISPSFRDHLYRYSLSKFPDIHNAIVLAETFKDYFKENAYPDLLIFEDEIANLASLVIIFLESPGSLVELGMFCTKPNFFKKLLIVAPQEETKDEDSFIYLGPLEHIRKKEPSSVAVYPWPISNAKYDSSHLEDLCKSIEEKLLALPKNVEFNCNNSGHVAFLIAEIIRICYPIILSEIEYVLMALDLEIKQSEITRHIYLLNKLLIVKTCSYSSYKYFYPNEPNSRIISFGKLSTGRSFDEINVIAKIRQSYVLNEDDQSRKRVNAFKQIQAIPKGAGK